MPNHPKDNHFSGQALLPALFARCFLNSAACVHFSGELLPKNLRFLFFCDKPFG